MNTPINSSMEEWREYNGGFAIDFGESSIKMAYFDNKGPQIIKLSPSASNNNSLPTTIWIDNNNQTFFGNPPPPLPPLPSQLLLTNNSSIISNDDGNGERDEVDDSINNSIIHMNGFESWTILDQFKAKFNDTSSNLPFIIDHNSIMDLMSQLIRHGIELSQQQMQNKISKAVVGQSTTCLNRREYWKDPFIKAGISVQRTIQEPIAACLNFKSCNLRGNILVIDWGHELKISMIEEESGIFQILSSYGNVKTLGGYSITMAMVQLCLERMTSIHSAANQQEDLKKLLFYECEKAKKLLSESAANNDHGLNHDCVKISILGEQVLITREELNQIYQEKLSQIPEILKKISKTSKPFDFVIQCGGCLYSKYLNDGLRSLFDNENNTCTICLTSETAPDEIIIRGIAQQAQYLHRPPLDNCLVSYILPNSIGVDSDSGKMLSIVPRNTWYAVSKEADLLRAVVNGEIVLNFFEGEYENVIDNVWLGQISFQQQLEGIENGSIVPISIRMHVDDDCNIMVNAQLQLLDNSNSSTTHSKQAMFTKYGQTLSKEEQLKMIEDSHANIGFKLPIICKQILKDVDMMLLDEQLAAVQDCNPFSITIEDVD